MIRKVNSVGTGTLTMSLPVEWVKKNRLEKGDVLNVNEDKEGHLILSVAELKDEHKIIDTDVTGLSPYLRKLVAGYYKAGYDELSIQYSSSSELDRIQSLLEYTCIGFEVMKIGPKVITVKLISKINFEEFQDMYRKIFNMIIGVSAELLTACERKDQEAIRSTIQRHKLVNRYSDFCRRVINKYPAKMQYGGPLYSAIESLEKISDLYRAFAEDVIAMKGLPSKNVTDLLKMTNRYFEEAKKLFYKYDHKAMQRFIQQKKEMNKELVSSTIAKNELMLFFYCKYIIQLAYDLNGPITTMNV